MDHHDLLFIGQILQENKKQQQHVSNNNKVDCCGLSHWDKKGFAQVQIDIMEHLQTENTHLYKINSTYTYGVISQDVQLLHQLTDGDLLGSTTNTQQQHRNNHQCCVCGYNRVTHLSPNLRMYR